MIDITGLELRQLRILDELFQLGSLTKVAAKLGISQQAVSEQLRKLRGIFQDRLFIRTSYGVVPTPKAEELQLKVSQILTAVDALAQPEEFDPKHLNGVYRISASDYAMQTVLPQLLEKVRASAPQLKIIIRGFESDHLHQLMATGEVDLALTFPAFIPDSCPSILLFEERHVCVTAKHRLDTLALNSLKQVAAEPQLVVSPSRPNLKGSADEWFAAKGYQRNIIMSVPSFAAAPDCIAATETLAFLPSRMLPNDKLAVVELEDKLPSFEIIAAWHQRSTQTAIHQWMIGLLQQLFPK